MAELSLDLANKKASVTQGNALARSVQKMSLYEKRLIYVALASISRDQTDFKDIEIPVVDLERLFGVNSKAIYKIAKEAVLALVERSILVGSDDAGWVAFQWVSRARYIPAGKHPKRLSTLQITFHEDLKPFLLELKNNFSSIPLLELLSLSSFNSARLFELLYHDSYRGQKAFLTYDVDDLKKRIGLEGKYEKFKDFRYVLDRAQSDLESHTSLRFSYEGIQRGRSTAQVRFRIVPNQDSLAVEPPTVEVSEHEDLVQALRDAGFNQDPAKTINSFGAERVEQNLRLALNKAREAAKTSKPIRNLGGLIYYMIENDLASQQSRPADTRLTAQQVTELANALKDAFDADIRATSEAIRKGFSDQEVDDFHDIMRVELSDYALKQLDKQHWQGASYEAVFFGTLYRFRRHLFPRHLESFQTWLNHEQPLQDLRDSDRERVLTRATSLL